MIYVTVGGKSSYGFYRLIKKMDDLAPCLNAPILMQIGDTKYAPVHADSFAYNSFADSMKLFSDADLVVSHCSTGTILNAKSLRPFKPTVVVPRLKKYNEHVDDHQLELAELIDKNRDPAPIFVIYDVELLEDRIREVIGRTYKGSDESDRAENPLIAYLKEYIAGRSQ